MAWLNLNFELGLYRNSTKRTGTNPQVLSIPLMEAMEAQWLNPVSQLKCQ